MKENAREWRHELAHTDPKLVKFCLDVDWVKRGGQDPMTLLRERAPRLRSLHLRSMRQGVWMEEFAAGDVDYRQVAAYLREIGFQGWLVVELAYEEGRHASPARLKRTCAAAANTPKNCFFRGEIRENRAHAADRAVALFVKGRR